MSDIIVDENLGITLTDNFTEQEFNAFLNKLLLKVISKEYSITCQTSSSDNNTVWYDIHGLKRKVLCYIAFYPTFLNKDKEQMNLYHIFIKKIKNKYACHIESVSIYKMFNSMLTLVPDQKDIFVKVVNIKEIISMIKITEPFSKTIPDEVICYFALQNALISDNIGRLFCSLYTKINNHAGSLITFT